VSGFRVAGRSWGDPLRLGMLNNVDDRPSSFLESHV
jgi:hypothetical protein